MPSGSDWYESEDALLATLRAGRGGARRTPAIPGYDGLVELGRGGQGVVYRATQRSTRRVVAIKLLLDGAFASEATRRRFEREVDLVAVLQHPHIVRLYDSGVTEDGHPYYVMEFIEGVSLDALIELPEGGVGSRSDVRTATGGSANRAAWAGRLELFEKICGAVNYAHQRGIIHRDLKPSNIRIDEAGEPHVLDFGLGKVALEDAAAADRSGMTLSGQFMGSLPWASPEQSEGRPEHIDIRSDVYALGVLLYQLLTGRFPYVVVGPFSDVIERIRHAPPARPSTLQRAIDDELETIVLKALAKEPERRYQSAGELAREVRRYLNHEPIEAKRDSAWYSLKTTLRRYRLVAGVSSAFLVIAVGVAIATTVLYGRAVRAERVADERRAVAEREADKARRTQQFLQGMFGALDPTQVVGRDTALLHELLDDAAGRVEAELGGRPEVEAPVRATIGRTYASLGDYAAADVNLARALELYRGVVGATAPETLGAMKDLSGVYQEQGRFAEAEPLVRAALEGLRQTLGPEHREALAAQNNLAYLLDNLGQPEQAEAEYRRTLEVQRRTLGEESADVLSTKANLAQLLLDRGAYDEATPLLREAYAARQRALGADHPDALIALNNLARLAQEQNQLDEAVALYSQAVDGCKRALGAGHPRTLMAMSNLAVLYRQLGRLGESETLLRQALEAQKQSIPEDDPAGMSLVNNLARTLHEAGKPDEAEPLLRRVFETLSRAYGDEHPKTLVALNNLAGVLNDLGRREEALELSRRCAEIRRRTLGPTHPDALLAGVNFAGNLRDAGRLEEALAQFDELSAAAADLPAEHWMLPFIKGGRGETLRLLKRFEDAEAPLLESHAAFQAAVGDDHPRTRQAAQRLFELYQAWGRPERAALYAREGVETAP